MKILFLSDTGQSLGLALRLSHDGHKILYGLLNTCKTPGLGEQLVPRVLKVRPDIRAVFHLRKQFPFDALIFDDDRHRELVQHLILRGIPVFGAFYPSKDGEGEAPESCRISGQLNWGGQRVLSFEGAVLFHPSRRRIAAVAIGEITTARAEGSGSCLETRFLAADDTLLSYTQEVLPGVMGALLERVENDAGELFGGQRGAVLSYRSTSLAVAIDPEPGAGAALEAVADEALKHVCPVSCRIGGGTAGFQSLVSLSNGPMCYVTAWGVNFNEAERRVRKTLERVSPIHVRYRNHVEEALAPLLHVMV